MSISQYLSDHAAAGACAYNYYNTAHDADTCLVAPGVCSMIAYLVAELKNAEQRAKQYVSVSPAAGNNLVGGAGQVSWGTNGNPSGTEVR